jgi:hypothetical protein
MATSSWRTNLRTVSGPRAAFPALLIVLLAAAACGGGVAPGVPTDGGAPTGADGTPDCNASTCASGCCDIQGRCQPGDTVTACGTSGQACQDCPASAYESCDAVQHVCLTELEQCGPSTCVGCCVQNVCYPGIDSPACGSGGQACASCTAAGLACAGQQCVTPCGPGTCAGCCAGNQCLAGTASTACGALGGACANCAMVGAACTSSEAATGGVCTSSAANCGPNTCPAGCCGANGVCLDGASVDGCGGRGTACRTCPLGDSCVNQACTAPPCTVTCPNGCCDLSGCEPGNSLTVCGGGGTSCEDCSIAGTQCVDQVCRLQPLPCACPLGCCDALNECQPGASNTQCGTGGDTCQDCASYGMGCAMQSCIEALDAAVCNAQSCPDGCCDVAGFCQGGVASTACGGFGTTCQDCLAFDAVCLQQQCASPDGGPFCNSLNCTGCCDALGRCQRGLANTICGENGGQCIDCTSVGDTCVNSECVAFDGGTICSQSCSGCCDLQGDCWAGFADTRCGASGTPCQDCTALVPASTCDGNISQRACTSQQMQCPAPYAGCSTAVALPAPVRQHACSTGDLQSAATACSGGAHTSDCDAFLSDESNANGSCYDCLQAFDYDFVEQTGVRSCVVPYIDATCNHNSACIVDCVTQGCFACLDWPSTELCDAQVQASSCLSYFEADSCVTQALDGPGAVCNPSTYQESFGGWLQAVGAAYCAE